MKTDPTTAGVDNKELDKSGEVSSGRRPEEQRYALAARPATMMDPQRLRDHSDQVPVRPTAVMPPEVRRLEARLPPEQWLRALEPTPPVILEG